MGWVPVDGSWPVVRGAAGKPVGRSCVGLAVADPAADGAAANSAIKLTRIRWPVVGGYATIGTYMGVTGRVVYLRC